MYNPFSKVSEKGSSSSEDEESAFLNSYRDHTPPKSANCSPRTSVEYKGESLLSMDEYHPATVPRHSFRSSAGRKLSLIAPSFLQKSAATPRLSKPSSTAYLDGVRGVASAFVFVHHFPMDYYPDWHNGFASAESEKLFLKLPFIRIIYSGRFMVGVFFVLSGFVLAHKPLKQVRAGQTASLLDTIASSVFRRGMRLFLPILLPTFIIMLMIHEGWYWSVNPIVPVPAILPLWDQIKEWARCILEIMNPFYWQTYSPPYATQLWTLPIEFRCSMIVFIMIVGFSRAKELVRITFQSILTVYCLTLGRWETFLFLSGMIISEFHIIRTASSADLDKVPHNIPRWRRLLNKSFWYANLIIAIYLGCWPDDYAEVSPGYISLAHMVPENYQGNEMMQRWWTSLAAVQLMIALEHLPYIQAFFTTPFAKYLGNISYALYIVHIPILYTFGRWLTLNVIQWAGEDSSWSYNIGFFISACIITPLTFWMADLCWRFVDAKSVEFARWFSSKCFVARQGA